MIALGGTLLVASTGSGSRSARRASYAERAAGARGACGLCRDRQTKRSCARLCSSPGLRSAALFGVATGFGQPPCARSGPTPWEHSTHRPARRSPRFGRPSSARADCSRAFPLGRCCARYRCSAARSSPTLYIDIHHVVERRDRVRMEVLEIAVIAQRCLRARRSRSWNVLDELFFHRRDVAVTLRLLVVPEERIHRRLRASVAPPEIVLAVAAGTIGSE